MTRGTNNIFEEENQRDSITRPAFFGILAIVVIVVVFAGYHFFNAVGNSGIQVEVSTSSDINPRDANAVTTFASEDEVARSTVNEMSDKTTIEQKSSHSSSELSGEALSEELVVYVSGAVKHPGVYAVKPGSRIVDAVEAAGGLKKNAQEEALNLAQIVHDSDHIHIPDTATRSEVASALSLPNQNLQAEDTSATEPSGLVNINTATTSQLQSLSGIGPATAEKIVADREQNGSFQSVDDLLRVSGIGEKKLASIRDSICV